jgi:hypothetical protein
VVECSRIVNDSGLRAQGSGLRAQGSGLRAQGSGLRALEVMGIQGGRGMFAHLCDWMHNTPHRISKLSPIDHARPCRVQRRKQLLFFILVQPAGEDAVADGVERADWHDLW